MTLWTENLQRLIALIDSKLAEVDHACPSRGQTTWTHDDWKKHDDGLAAIIDRLQSDERALFKDGSDCRLRIAGVAVTCTSGRHGLLRNWQNAARKKIATAEQAEDPINLQGFGPAAIEAREG